MNSHTLTGIKLIPNLILYKWLRYLSRWRRGAGLEEGAGRRWRGRGGGALGGVYHRADEQITVKDEACMHRPPPLQSSPLIHTI